MMPPKKSRAARAKENLPKEPEPVENNNENEATRAEENGDVKGEEPSLKEKKFMWEDKIVEGKRKRVMPASEQSLHDWFNDHLEEREETKVVVSDVYNIYLDGCISSSTFGVDQITFSKILHQRFPKSFGVKESSAYHSMIKEKKIRKKVDKPKVQADSLKLKLRDLIENFLTEMGNPRKGVRFHNIKQHIALRYPALRIDVRPNILKSALEKGIRFGYIIRVKGIGAAGFYRLPGGPDEDEEEEKDKKDKKEGKEAKEKKEGGEEDGKEAETDKDDADEKDEKDEDKKEGKDSDAKKTRGKKKEPEEDKKKKDAPKKKNKKKAPPRKNYRSYVLHSDPQRIEDTFQLAMTFMAEPKEASVGKIRRYIQKWYRDVDVDARLKKTLLNGTEKGYWEQVSGSGPTQGSYRLLVDEFDPTDDDDMIGKVVNAIMACVDPKECSANLLKRYVLEYHPDFKVQEKPYLFKKALERSLRKNQIRQITGIGATGTFQLAQPFNPGPIILAGQDTGSDYGDEEDDTPMDLLEVPDVSLFQDSYVPRPSRSRGHGRKSAAGIDRFSEVQFDKRYVQKTSNAESGGGGGGRGRNDFSVDDFKDAYVPRPTTSRGHSRKASQGIERFRDTPVQRMKKPLKKGQKATQRSADKKPARSPKKPKYEESSDSDSDSSSSSSSDSDTEDDLPPPPKKIRGPPTDRSKAPATKTPAKSKGKTSKPSPVKTPASKSPAPEPPASKGKAKSKGRGKSRR